MKFPWTVIRISITNLFSGDCFCLCYHGLMKLFTVCILQRQSMKLGSVCNAQKHEAKLQLFFIQISE
jgi:hypothetical protein